MVVPDHLTHRLWNPAHVGPARMGDDPGIQVCVLAFGQFPPEAVDLLTIDDWNKITDTMRVLWEHSRDIGERNR